MATEPKPEGQGKGKYTKKGVQAEQEDRIASLEAALEAHTADEHGPDLPEDDAPHPEHPIA